MYKDRIHNLYKFKQEFRRKIVGWCEEKNILEPDRKRIIDGCNKYLNKITEIIQPRTIVFAPSSRSNVTQYQ